MFFPLREPVELSPGDLVSLAFSASLLGDEYAFRWDTRVASPSNPRSVKAAFTQSTLFAWPLSAESLGGAKTATQRRAAKRGKYLPSCSSVRMASGR